MPETTALYVSQPACFARPGEAEVFIGRQMQPERLLTNPAATRLPLRVSEIRLDDDGNARQARIEMLEYGTTGTTGWVDMATGKRYCLNGFRFELRQTRRAGLHIRVGLAEDGAPRDSEGYLIDQPRYVATAKIQRNGVLVLTPGLSYSAGYLLENGALPSDQDELETVTGFLGAFFRTGGLGAIALLRGRGTRMAELEAVAKESWKPVSAVIVTGEADVWHAFNPDEGLEALRGFVASLTARADGYRHGVTLTRAIGLTTHMADILRLAKLPSRMRG